MTAKRHNYAPFTVGYLYNFEPLRKSLKGYWKLRVGDYRVVFRVIEAEVWILAIRRRKSVYPDIGTQK